MAIDLDTATTDDLAKLADFAFRLGFADGLRTAVLLSKHQLRQKMPAYDGRRLHAIKFRQIYGAGFDIARMMIRMKEFPETADGVRCRVWDSSS